MSFVSVLKRVLAVFRTYSLAVKRDVNLNLFRNNKIPLSVVSSTKVDPLYIGLIITVSLILLTVALASFKMLRSNRVRSNSKTVMSTFY